jgi:hypothetical protein
VQHNNKVQDEGSVALGEGLRFNSSLQVLELVSRGESLFLRPMHRWLLYLMCMCLRLMIGTLCDEVKVNVRGAGRKPNLR